MRRPTILHVRIDEPGGAARHVSILIQDAARLGYEGREVTVPPAWLKRSPLGWLRAVLAIWRCVRATETALVHAHGVRIAAAAGLAASLRRLPLVVTVHGFHAFRRSRMSQRRLYIVLNRLALSSARRVLVLSGADRSSMVESRLVPESRVRLVRAAFAPPQGTPASEARASLGISREPTVILWVGRFDPQKDPVTFVEAMRAVGREGDVVGVMVGDGPLLESIASMVAETGPERLVLTGWLEDPSQAYSAADVYVSTSRWEALPLTALEAASCGIPMVLSKCPGNDELQRVGVPALWFEPASSDELASQLVRLLVDEDLAKELSQEARRRVGERFTPAHLAEDVCVVYRDVLPVPTGRVG